MSATEEDRALARALTLLGRPGARLTQEGPEYAVRAQGDRRRRPAMRIGEAAFRRLAREPGLKPRDGGWVLAGSARVPEDDSAGRPALIAGERAVAEGDGVVRRRAANLGESPIAWLARRKDAQGRPWLTPAQAAAGEKLREDFLLAGRVGRTTMAWDAGPKGSGRGAGLDPMERGLAAKARVRAALAAAGPAFTPMLELVCLRGSALEAAERGLGLKRREGKHVLRQALERLAAHYRMI